MSQLTHRQKLLECEFRVFTHSISGKWRNRSFSGHRQDHHHDGVHIVRIWDGIVRVLRDAAQVDVIVVVVVVIDVVVCVGDRVERQHHEGQKIEAVEAEIADSASSTAATFYPH